MAKKKEIQSIDISFAKNGYQVAVYYKDSKWESEDFVFMKSDAAGVKSLVADLLK